MKQTKNFILSMNMLLVLVYILATSPLTVFGTEVPSVETKASIGFTGFYETPGTPEPAPEVGIKPTLPKEIAQSPSEVRRKNLERLPKTNEEHMRIWSFLGILILIATLLLWGWTKKERKQELNT